MNEWKAGLEGIVAARTALSEIDGVRGRLSVRGYPMAELAPAATFEETFHLLWRGELPTAAECVCLGNDLSRHRSLPSLTVGVLRQSAQQKLSPIEALRLGIDTLGISDDDDESALRLIAATPAIVAAYWRLMQGHDIVESPADLGIAAGFLFMLRGGPPSETAVRCLETYLNTMSDHGLNASTFTARVILSTRSDLKSAIVGALDALKGPVHGGAPQPALEMLQRIGTPGNARQHLQDILNRGERIMGFGHREYRVRDPRAQILSDAAARLSAADGGHPLYLLALEVEEIATRLLDKAKQGRDLKTNAEFYTAALLHQLGIEPELFTSVFAISRMAGWLAHCREQRQVDRIFRPTSEYVGPGHREWTPVDER